MKISDTTNVSPWDLNYDHYSPEQYDRDIINSIPFHAELHEKILDFLKQNWNQDDTQRVLDLGAGTGLTSSAIKKTFPGVELTVNDFSKTMLAGARKKLGEIKVKYILGDYAEIDWGTNYDLIITVIGLHHQSSKGAQSLVKKAFSSLNSGGFLIIGDLMTVADKSQAALDNARHYHHLVSRAMDEKTLCEWAYHHQFLNDLKTLEDHRKWLRDGGFEIACEWGQWNTKLLIAQKP